MSEPTLTFHELVKIARRRGYVRWTTSGIVEQVMAIPGGLRAVNPFSGRGHWLHTHRRNVGGGCKLRDKWHCEEVDLDSLWVRAGDLYDALYNGKSLVVSGVSGGLETPVARPDSFSSTDVVRPRTDLGVSSCRREG